MYTTTCLFTRLEESSLVPPGFLTAQLLQKTEFMMPFFYGRTRLKFLFVDSMEKKKREDKSISHPSSFPILSLSSRTAVK